MSSTQWGNDTVAFKDATAATLDWTKWMGVRVKPRVEPKPIKPAGICFRCVSLCL